MQFGIVERYGMSSLEKRIEIILSNLRSFERILKGCELSLSAKIYDTREFNRRRGFDDIGIRIKGCNLNDPTSGPAISREDICIAIRDGDWMTALKGADNKNEYRWKILTISRMWTDYYIVKGAVETLGENEYSLFWNYEKYNDDKQKLADVMGVSVDALRARVYRVKRSVKDCVIQEIERDYNCKCA